MLIWPRHATWPSLLEQTGTRCRRGTPSGWRRSCPNGRRPCLAHWSSPSAGSAMGPAHNPRLSVISRYAALGKQRTRYLLYKDVNRSPLWRNPAPPRPGQERRGMPGRCPPRSGTSGRGSIVELTLGWAYYLRFAATQNCSHLIRSLGNNRWSRLRRAAACFLKGFTRKKIPFLFCFRPRGRHWAAFSCSGRSRWWRRWRPGSASRSSSPCAAAPSASSASPSPSPLPSSSPPPSGSRRSPSSPPPPSPRAGVPPPPSPSSAAPLRRPPAGGAVPHGRWPRRPARSRSMPLWSEIVGRRRRHRRRCGSEVPQSPPPPSRGRRRRRCRGWGAPPSPWRASAGSGPRRSGGAAAAQIGSACGPSPSCGGTARRSWACCLRNGRRHTVAGSGRRRRRRPPPSGPPWGSPAGERAISGNMTGLGHPSPRGSSKVGAAACSSWKGKDHASGRRRQRQRPRRRRGKRRPWRRRRMRGQQRLRRWRWRWRCCGYLWGLGIGRGQESRHGRGGCGGRTAHCGGASRWPRPRGRAV